MAEIVKKYAPGMRVMIRGEEWMIKKIENNTLGNKALYVVGLSRLVKDQEAIFLDDLEKDNIEIVDPTKVKLVPDDSPYYSEVRYMPIISKKEEGTFLLLFNRGGYVLDFYQ